MSISSNSRLKAAFTSSGHTMLAVAHLTGTFVGISPILQQRLKAERGDARRMVSLIYFCPQGHSALPHDRRVRDTGLWPDPSGRHGWKCLHLVAGAGWKIRLDDPWQKVVAQVFQPGV